MTVEDKTKLSDAELEREVAALDSWTRDGVWLQKDFVFDNFKEINAFLPHLTANIVEQNHHPEFSLDTGSKTVAVKMTTHSEGCITRADIDLARALDAWPRPQ